MVWDYSLSPPELDEQRRMSTDLESPEVRSKFTAERIQDCWGLIFLDKKKRHPPKEMTL